jgi:ABC-type transporter Mla MlaB component
MLRIFRIIDGGRGETIKLEGSLHGPWVEEVRKAYDSTADQASLIRLDLADLTYLDEDGRVLLCKWIRRGAEVTACSRYVSAVLQMEP